MRPAGLSARLLPALLVAGFGSLVIAAGEVPARVVSVSAIGQARTQAVLIEASEPAAYAVSRPDPLTIIVELRNVRATGAPSRVSSSGLVRDIHCEDDVALDGNAVGRIRIALTAPATHKVRSERNTIRVDLDADAAAIAAPAAPRAVPPATALATAPTTGRTGTVLQSVRASREGARTTITISGNGMLVPGNVSEAQDLPPRLVLDFPGVTFTATPQTTVGGTVRRVRVAMNRRTPPVTRVVVDLEKQIAFHVERTGPNGADIAIVFEDGAASGPVLLTPIAGEQPDPDATEPRPASAADLAAAAGTGAIDPMAALRIAVAPPQTAAKPEQKAAAPAPRTAAPKASPPAPAQPAPAQTVPAPPPAQSPVTAPPAEPPQRPQTRAIQQTATPEQTKKYTGHPVSLDFQNADLRAVLRTFAEISGLNMVIDPGVQGTVDIVLTDVPWDQALDIILRANSLGYAVDGTIVRIAKLDTLQGEQEQRKKFAQAQAEAGDLRVRTWTLSYSKAGDIQPLITKSALSSRGQIQVDARTNTLIITDLPERLDTAANLISILDRAEPQVEVEARVVQTTREFARSLGVQWGFGGRMSPELGNTTNLAFPNRVITGGRTGANQGPSDVRSQASDSVPAVVNLPVTGEGVTAVGIQLGAVNGAFNLDLALTALERSGKGRVLSTPRLTTQNNIEAEVAQGIQIPIQTVANNTVTVTFKDAVLLLKVTPQITSANTVIMKITIENASPDWSRSVNNIPPIDTQRANTQVQVNDGATTVIGGIFVSQEQDASTRTPLLYRIPLLGWLFKRDSISDESRELLIFITPRILRG